MLVELDIWSLGSSECYFSSSDVSPPSGAIITLHTFTDFLFSLEAVAMSLSSWDHETAQSYLEWASLTL